MIGTLFGTQAPMTMYGFKVYVQPDHPKMQLGEPVKEFLTPEQIADHNAWMLDFFGFTNSMKDGQYVVSEVFQFVSMNPRTYEQFRRAAFNG